MKIAERWFEFKKTDDGVTLIWEPYSDPLIRCNIWHVKGKNRDMLVDTGLGIVSLKEAAKHIFDNHLTAVATHTHFDHIGGMFEFDDRVVHELEATNMADAIDGMVLRVSGFNHSDVQIMRDAGYALDQDELITALPSTEFGLDAHELEPASPTWTVVEGDIIDLGNRVFEVIHLPGHSTGSIGLWEEKTGILFSGDAVYDGPLLTNFPGADINDYVQSMLRLRKLPVNVVHGGHEPSFGRERLVQIIDHYLGLWSSREAIPVNFN